MAAARPERSGTMPRSPISHWKPTGILYPLGADGATGSPRYDHVATGLPANDGFLVTGGQSADGEVTDNWLVGALVDPTSQIADICGRRRAGFSPRRRWLSRAPAIVRP